MYPPEGGIRGGNLSTYFGVEFGLPSWWRSTLASLRMLVSAMVKVRG